MTLKSSKCKPNSLSDEPYSGYKCGLVYQMTLNDLEHYELTYTP